MKNLPVRDSGGFSTKIRGAEMLNLQSISEVVEYSPSIVRVYVFFIRKKLPRKLRLRKKLVFLLKKVCI